MAIMVQALRRFNSEAAAKVGAVVAGLVSAATRLCTARPRRLELLHFEACLHRTCPLPGPTLWTPMHPSCEQVDELEKLLNKPGESLALALVAATLMKSSARIIMVNTKFAHIYVRGRCCSAGWAGSGAGLRWPVLPLNVRCCPLLAMAVPHCRTPPRQVERVLLSGRMAAEAQRHFSGFISTMPRGVERVVLIGMSPFGIGVHRGWLHSSLHDRAAAAGTAATRGPGHAHQLTPGGTAASSPALLPHHSVPILQGGGGGGAHGPHAGP